MVLKGSSLWKHEARTKPLRKPCLLLYQTQVLDCQFHTRMVWSSEALRIQGYSWKTIQTKGFNIKQTCSFRFCDHSSLKETFHGLASQPCQQRDHSLRFVSLAASSPPFYQLSPHWHLHMETSKWKPDKGIKDPERQITHTVLTCMYMCVHVFLLIRG